MKISIMFKKSFTLANMRSKNNNQQKAGEEKFKDTHITHL